MHAHASKKRNTKDLSLNDLKGVGTRRLDAPIFANAVIGNVDAGLVVVGRGMLHNPHWVLETRVKLKKAVVPKKYSAGF